MNDAEREIVEASLAFAESLLAKQNPIKFKEIRRLRAMRDRLARGDDVPLDELLACGVSSIIREHTYQLEAQGPPPRRRR